MKTIYKYEIKNPYSTITLPCGYDILCAKVQVSGMFEELFLWALVNPDEEKQEDVRIRVFATGDDIDNPQELVYIDTVMMRNGALVFHVFMVESGRENPLRWRAPEKELPEEYTPVLVRYGHIETRKAVVWLMVTPEGRRVWNVDNSNMVILDKDIIGWRPIIEL